MGDPGQGIVSGMDGPNQGLARSVMACVDLDRE